MNRRFTGLWRNPDFMKLWVGQTISEFGSRITRDGLPLTAVIILSATPEQMGVLAAVSSLPILCLGLVAGVWVDRLRRRPIMIASDIARLLILLSIPFAALTGTLSMGLVLVVAALTAVLGLFFDLAYRAVLPSLVERENLLEGNTKLATTDSLAEIGGPAIAGLLIQVIGAPLAIFFDAMSFLFSAVSVALIRKPESMPSRWVDGQNVWREIAEGLRVIAGHPVLRTLTLGTGIRSFFGNFYAVLYSLYCIRELGHSPATLGLLIASGGVGALVGSMLAGRLTRRYTLGRTLTGTLLIGGVIGLLTPLAGGPIWLSATMLMISQLVNDGAMTIYMINEMSLRHMLVPDHLLGRTNASIGFLAEGVGPVGAVIAGLLAGIIGARATLLIAVLGTMAAAVWMQFSSVRDLESHPEPAI